MKGKRGKTQTPGKLTERFYKSKTTNERLRKAETKNLTYGQMENQLGDGYTLPSFFNWLFNVLTLYKFLAYGTCLL
jgi:hypothetical protein